MTDEFELSRMNTILDEINTSLYVTITVKDEEDEEAYREKAYTITEVLQDMIAAIDRNTAAITALKAELETAQLQNRQ